MYECPSKNELSVAPPRAKKAKGLCRILLIPSLIRVVLPVPGGPLIAMALPTAFGFVIH